MCRISTGIEIYPKNSGLADDGKIPRTGRALERMTGTSAKVGYKNANTTQKRLALR
jgi:hypothetical protein